MTIGGGRRHVKATFGEQPDPSLAYGYPDVEPETWGHWLLWAGLLIAIVALTYSVVATGGFLWGDDVNVTENPLLSTWRGLYYIWRSPHHAPQFSPLGYTSLLIDARIWGSDAKRAAAGFHLINILLHAINALLLWTLLRKLS